MSTGKPATIYFINVPEQGDNNVYIFDHAEMREHSFLVRWILRFCYWFPKQVRACK